MNAPSRNRHLSGQNPDRMPMNRKSPPARFPKESLPADTGNEIWLITLSDLLLLMLIFFVLLFAVIMNRQNLVAAVPAAPPSTAPVVESPAVAAPPPPREIASPAPAQTAALALEADLAELLGQHRNEGEVTLERRSNSLIATFPERIVFDSGISELKGSVQPLLEKVALFIRNHPEVAIEVHGHTDDRPISNQRFPSNWELSADRATQVAKALVRLGTDPARLSVRGFGEYRPLVANDSDLNRVKNRRVEIQFSLLSAAS